MTTLFQSYRARSGRFFSVSTEDSSMDSTEIVTTGRGSGIKSSKQRWSGFFTNTKGTKMELLVEQLNSYTKHGVQQLSEIQLPYDPLATQTGSKNFVTKNRIKINSNNLNEKT